MSWQKAAWLLAGDQVCLAIMAQTWSLSWVCTHCKSSFYSANWYLFSVLGWVPGIITMVLAGVLFWITSITMHKFIMKNPQIRDICKSTYQPMKTLQNWWVWQTGDFGYYAFGKTRIAYEWTGFMLLANNILLIGFHILTGAKVLNTLSDHSQCTVVFSIIAMLMGIVMSLPRTLKHVSFMSMGSGE